jgi:hypothetical protein
MKKALPILAITFVVSVMWLTGCKSSPISIADAKFMGCTWSQHQNRASIISQDGGLSFVVPGGSVWAFGDTFMGKRDSRGTPHFKGGALFCTIAFLPENAESFPPALRYKSGPDGVAVSPLSLLPGEKEEIYRIWPLSGIYADNKYYIYYCVIRKTGDGMWDFEDVGAGLAVSRKPLGQYKRLQSNGDWRFPAAPTQVVKSGPWLYLYEIIKRDGKMGAALARVKTEAIASPDAYEYYDRQSKKFTKNKAAQSILVPAPGQVSVAFNPYCGGWLMATSSDFFNPRRIILYLAPAPEGPWEFVGSVKAPEKCQGKKVQLVYCTYLHPELFRKNGEIINLTFSLHLENGGFDANCEMAEITLKRNTR